MAMAADAANNGEMRFIKGHPFGDRGTMAVDYEVIDN
jgi:hypothetical protein